MWAGYDWMGAGYDVMWAGYDGMGGGTTHVFQQHLDYRCGAGYDGMGGYDMGCVPTAPPATRSRGHSPNASSNTRASCTRTLTDPRHLPQPTMPIART